MIGLLIWMAACGGGGGSVTTPSPPPDPTPSERSARFNSGADDFPLPETIVLDLVESSPDDLTMALIAQRVTDLYGYGVDLPFDPTILEFQGFRTGSFLERSDTDVTTQVAENPDGNLVIGQSRLGDVDGADGSGQLVLLDFAILDNGSTAMSPSDGTAFDGDGDEIEVDFFGGTLTISGGS